MSLYIERGPSLELISSKGNSLKIHELFFISHLRWHIPGKTLTILKNSDSVFFPENTLVTTLDHISKRFLRKKNLNLFKIDFLNTRVSI